ncbi:MAG: hypothetical protein LBS18_07725 [Clostridiales bacterium]|jgi:hypothetical protein|nr:hypothetical protein [Clostridiales bacterium]
MDMVCSHCGAYYDKNSEYCPVCRAPLPVTFQADEPQTTPESNDSANWGFVQPPRWPKPNFDINAVNDMGDDDPGTTSAHTTPGFAVSPVYPGPENTPPYVFTPPAAPQLPQESAYPPDDDAASQPPYGESAYVGQAAGGYRPIQSVSGYDTAGGYHTGSFGRAPQRVDYDDIQDEEDTYTVPRNMRSATQRNAPYNRRSPIKPRGLGSRGFKRRGNMLFVIIAGVLIVLLIIFGSILINKNGGLKGLFSGSPILKEPTIDTVLNNSGEECWKIVVYAKAGNTVHVRVGNVDEKETIDSTNLIPILIPKYLLLPETPVEGVTADVVPDITLITEDGEVIPIDIPAITVDVPTLTLNVSSPANTTLSVSRDKLTFEGTVDNHTPNSPVTISVNGTPLTVADNGAFTGEYTLPDAGQNTLMLEARKIGYQIARVVYSIDYAQEVTVIDVDKSTLRAAGEGDTTNVQGTVEPGSDITLSGPAGVTLGTPNITVSTGVFTFTAKMDAVGYYPIEVTVTKDGRSVTGTVIVERAPERNEYTSSVHKVDYDRFIKEPNHKAAYQCVGKVVEVLQEEPYIIAKLQMSDGDILFEYHNTTASVSTEDTRTHNIWGDFIGIDESTGLPLIYAWYITKRS